MTTKQAVERLNLMIEQCERYEDAVLQDDNEDMQELLHETEIDIETLRMAKRALESKPHWIPCSERIPKTHEVVDYTGRCEESDLVLICDVTEPQPQVHVGCCWTVCDKTWWRSREWRVLDKVVAWMPLPDVYKDKG